MNKIEEIERTLGVSLPLIYREFFAMCEEHVPGKLVGTDLLNFYPDMKSDAIKLLHNNGIPNFLRQSDVVFLMHQGYIFFYFEAGLNPNPPVFKYHELAHTPTRISKLSRFLKAYL